MGNHMVVDGGFANDDVTKAVDAITYSEWTDEAIEAAYIEYVGQSYKSLVETVQGKGFDLSQSEIAADAVQDWYTAALTDASDYLTTYPSCGYIDLYTHLEDNSTGLGYSDLQAAYGADNAKDWYGDALAEANNQYLSYSRMIDYLMYIGYTYDQAVYAADQQNYQDNANQKANDYYSSHMCGYFDIVEYLIDVELFTEAQATTAPASCGVYLSDDPRYYQGKIYADSNPGCSKEDIYDYLYNFLGYSEIVSRLVSDALTAKG